MVCDVTIVNEIRQMLLLLEIGERFDLEKAEKTRVRFGGKTDFMLSSNKENTRGS